MNSYTFKALIFFLTLCTVDYAIAVEYDCKVSKKFDSENTYSKQMIEKYKYSLKIQENSEGAFLSRCSFIDYNKEKACDKYQVEKVVIDEHVDIKKFYVFRSQFDVQLFPNLMFVENNGRGSIAYGSCVVSRP